jgi:hypothetical protein
MRLPLLAGVAASTLLLAGTAAQAQTTFGVRLGLNSSNINYKVDDSQDEMPDSKRLLGPQVGVVMNAQFGNLSVQPALLYSMKGDKLSEKDTETQAVGSNTYTYSYDIKSTRRLSYLELPVNFVYSLNGEEGGFQVFAGPYVGLGIGGEVDYTVKFSETLNGQVTESGSESESLKIKYANKYGDDEDSEYVRTLDAGLNFGVGYKTGPFQAQLGYGLGLANLIPADEDGTKSKDKAMNRNIQFNLTYFFGGK